MKQFISKMEKQNKSVQENKPQKQPMRIYIAWTAFVAVLLNRPHIYFNPQVKSVSGSADQVLTYMEELAEIMDIEVTGSQVINEVNNILNKN